MPDRRLMVLNPSILARYSGTVQLFVFHHECGHHSVGGSELAADCWAVGRGVRDGWLDARGLTSVCASFGNAPETPTHPSGRRRCMNLDRCFATVTAELARERGQETARVAAAQPATTAPTQPPPAKAEARPRAEPAAATPRSIPRLVQGPRLVWSGRG